MDVARATQQHAAMAVGIVDPLGRLLDPVDRSLGKLEGKTGAGAQCEIGDGVKHGTDLGCPAGRLTIINKAPGARCAVDRLAQACTERLVVGLHCRCCRIELAKQRWIPLRQIHDHLDKGIDTLLLQMFTNPGKRAETIRLVSTQVVRRQCRGHHMLAEAPILERGTGAFAVKILAAPCEFRPVVFRARDLRQHAPRLNDENLNLAAAIIGLAASEYLRAGKLV